MSAREEFIEIYQAQITRPGADALLEYLEHKSDFFTAFHPDVQRAGEWFIVADDKGLPIGRPFSGGQFLLRFFIFLPRLQLLSENIGQKFIYDLCRPLLHIAGGVGVGVQREGRPGMTQDA